MSKKRTCIICRKGVHSQGWVPHMRAHEARGEVLPTDGNLALKPAPATDFFCIRVPIGPHEWFLATDGTLTTDKIRALRFQTKPLVEKY